MQTLNATDTLEDQLINDLRKGKISIEPPYVHDTCIFCGDYIDSTRQHLKPPTASCGACAEGNK